MRTQEPVSVAIRVAQLVDAGDAYLAVVGGLVYLVRLAVGLDAQR